MNDVFSERPDDDVLQILAALSAYKESHPAARIDAHRQNSVSIRIRIVDPDFTGMSRVDREPHVWKLLKKLPDEVFTNITMLLLLTPAETEDSFANREFDDPIPSRL